MQDPSVIVVRSDSEIETYEQLIENSQDNPLNWGVAQVGGTEHIVIARWAEAAGVEFRAVRSATGAGRLPRLGRVGLAATSRTAAKALARSQTGKFGATPSP